MAERRVFWKDSGGFSGGSVLKNPPANAGDMSLIPGRGRPPLLQSNQACAAAIEPVL